MKICIAITDAITIPTFFNKTDIKLNYLKSYSSQAGNVTEVTETYRPMTESVCLDSGTFTAFTQGKKVNLREYSIFLKKYGDLYDNVFSLDESFDDWEINYENQLYLEKVLKEKSWKPIPVIHDREDPYREFEMYVNMGYTYIALGSMGARKKIPLKISIKIKQDFPDTKLHVFGNLNFEMLKELKPYSADSTGWALQGGFGSIYYWLPSENKGISLDTGSVDSALKNKYHVKKSPYWDEIEQFLREKFGFTYSSVVSSPMERWVVNLYYFHQMETYLNSLETLVSDASVKTAEETK